MLIRQQHEIITDVFEDAAFARQWSRLLGSRLGSANQVQQVIFDEFGGNGCAQAWSFIYTFDMRFVGSFTCNHLRDRFIVVMASSSAEPFCVCTGADVSTLAAWEGPTPANFGGDGYGWWKVAYVSPNQDALDFTGTTGAFRFATSFTCEGDLPSGSGNYGDGVAIIFSDDSLYSATFGTATATADVSTAGLPLDALFLWVYANYRSIDDITQTKTFHNEDNTFNDNYSTHGDILPAEPSGGVVSSIDWTTDSRPTQESAVTYTMEMTVDAVAAVFPGACRVKASAFGANLRALCA